MVMPTKARRRTTSNPKNDRQLIGWSPEERIVVQKTLAEELLLTNDLKQRLGSNGADAIVKKVKGVLTEAAAQWPRGKEAQASEEHQEQLQEMMAERRRMQKEVAW